MLKNTKLLSLIMILSSFHVHAATTTMEIQQIKACLDRGETTCGDGELTSESAGVMSGSTEGLRLVTYTNIINIIPVSFLYNPNQDATLKVAYGAMRQHATSSLLVEPKDLVEFNPDHHWIAYVEKIQTEESQPQTQGAELSLKNATKDRFLEVSYILNGTKQTYTLKPGEIKPIGSAFDIKDIKYKGTEGASVTHTFGSVANPKSETKYTIVFSFSRLRYWKSDLKEETVKK